MEDDLRDPHVAGLDVGVLAVGTHQPLLASGLNVHLHNKWCWYST